MKLSFKIFIVCMATLSVLILSSCGKKEISEDITPFEKAITSRLASEQMGMKVNKFRDLKIEGDTANATCSMKSQTGLGPAVTWKFQFKKDGSDWKVSDFQY